MFTVGPSVLNDSQRFDLIEVVLARHDLTVLGQLAAIQAIANARHSEADITKTRELAEQFGWKCDD